MSTCFGCDRPGSIACECKKHYCRLCYLTKSRCQFCGSSFSVTTNPHAAKIRGIPTGKDHAASFERTCQAAFEWLFVPPLGPPRKFKATYDGRSKRDSLFPNDARDGFWRRFYEDHNARIVLLEAKNSGAPLGVRDVRQVTAYLRKDTLGRFGIICARRKPGPLAKTEQLSSYREDGVMILIVEDADLFRMIAMKERRLDPAEFLNELRLRVMAQA